MGLNQAPKLTMKVGLLKRLVRLLSHVLREANLHRLRTLTLDVRGLSVSPFVPWVIGGPTTHSRLLLSELPNGKLIALSFFRGMRADRLVSWLGNMGPKPKGRTLGRRRVIAASKL